MFNLKITKKRRILGDLKNTGWLFYWLVMFALFIIILLGIILFGLNTYFKIDRDQIFVEKGMRDKRDELVSINKEELLEVNFLFEQKTEKLEKLKEGGSVGLADPSK